MVVTLLISTAIDLIDTIHRMSRTTFDYKSPEEINIMTQEGILTAGPEAGQYVYTSKAFEDADYALSAEALILRSRIILAASLTEDMPN
jgi:hypothetical protein